MKKIRKPQVGDSVRATSGAFENQLGVVDSIGIRRRPRRIQTRYVVLFPDGLRKTYVDVTQVGKHKVPAKPLPFVLCCDDATEAVIAVAATANLEVIDEATMTRAREATMDVWTTMSAFTNIQGDVFAEAVRLVQCMSSMLNTDLEAATVWLGKVLNDPVKGMAVLAEVGVSFTDEQKELVERCQKSGNITGAQRVFIAELKDVFTGATMETAEEPVPTEETAEEPTAEPVGPTETAAEPTAEPAEDEELTEEPAEEPTKEEAAEEA